MIWIDREPVKSRMRDAVLFPDDASRQGVTSELRHPGHGGGVFAIEPMPFVGVDFYQVRVAFGIGFVQGGEVAFPLGGDLVAVEGGGVSAYVDGEGDVSQSERRNA